MTQPIRVLCVFSQLNRGGAETMCMNLYRRIDRSRVQFDFIKHSDQEGAYEEEIRALGGKIYAAPKYRIYNHAAYCAWWRRFLKAHPEHQIIHGHYYTISPIYFSVAHKLGRVTIGHSHCADFEHKTILSKIKKMVLMNTEKCSDYCLACSRDAGEYLFPRKSYTILNNAIDAGKYAFDSGKRRIAREEFGLNGFFVVGTVGRLVEQKNPDAVISIFAEIYHRDPNSRLLWVGDGELRDAIRSRLRALGLEHAVVMTGVRSDVDSLMSAMDVFLFPSLFEGLGVVAIEAQAAGLLCFCSENVPKEAAVTDLCEFLPLDHDELWAERILSVRNSERRDMREAIKASGYDVDETAEWLCRFYLQIVNEGEI